MTNLSSQCYRVLKRCIAQTPGLRTCKIWVSKTSPSLISFHSFSLSFVHTFPKSRPTYIPFLFSSAIQNVGFPLIDGPGWPWGGPSSRWPVVVAPRRIRRQDSYDLPVAPRGCPFFTFLSRLHHLSRWPLFSLHPGSRVQSFCFLLCFGMFLSCRLFNKAFEIVCWNWTIKYIKSGSGLHI